MSVISKIEEQFTIVETERNEMQGRVKLLKEQAKSSKDEIDYCKKEYKIMERVLNALRKLAILKEQVLREKIDNIITKGLRLIFGEGYKSKLEFGISRGQAVIKPKIITIVNGEELETGIADGHGGGITNVVSVLYQILVLALVRPMQQQIIFLDESFKNLSEEYLEATGEFLKSISQKLNIQIVLISHRKQLHETADCLYEFSISNGITKANRIK